jgi:hypothetical protein
MKTGKFKHGWGLAALIFFIAAAVDVAQQIPPGHSTAFSTDMYYQHPHEQQVQTRLSGAEATPRPGGLLDVKDLKMQLFNTNGTLRLVARAPQCTYAMLDGTADSAGHLQMQSGDGKYFVEGDGFLIVYHGSTVSLMLSNQVHTVVKTGFMRLTGP